MKVYSQKTKFFGTAKTVIATIAVVIGVFMAALITFTLLFDNHFIVTDKPVSFSSLQAQVAEPASPVVRKLALDSYSVLSCPTTQLCYAIDSSGTVGISNDQGKTWQTAPASLKLEGELEDWKMNCPDEKTCYATVYNRKPPYSIYYVSTKDGANSWSIQTTTRASSNDIVESIDCPTSLFCVAVTSSELQVTRDGGQNWSGKSISNLHSFNAVDCLDADTCFVAGGVSGPESIGGYLLVTNDGGKNWTRKSIRGDAFSIDTISCPDKSSCIVGGSPGSLYRVSEGGNKWEKLTYPLNQSYSVTSVSCTDSAHCLFTIRKDDTGGTYISKDGGKNWQLNSSKGLKWATCVSPGLCYGFSSKVLAFSNDGGETWRN